MKQEWDSYEMIEHFTLFPTELAFLGENAPHNHLGKALLLKFFQHEYRFPEKIEEIPEAIVEYLSQQLNLQADVIRQYNWQGRSIKQHRVDIRERMGFQRATVADQQKAQRWLENEALPNEYRLAHLKQLMYQYWRRRHIEPPTQNQIERSIVYAINQYEKALFIKVYSRLSSATQTKLRLLIFTVTELNEELKTEVNDSSLSTAYPIHDLKAGAGQAKVNNIKKVASRLRLLQEVGLPSDLFADVPLPFLKQYQQRVAVESISHLQRRDKKE